MAFFACAFLFGCVPAKDDFTPGYETSEFQELGGELIFNVEENELTKAMVERTSITGFNCMILKSDNSVFVNNTATVKSGSVEKISGRYWPSSGTLSFFGVLPTVAMTNTNGTVTVPVGTSTSKLTGNEDYVFASRRSVSNATSPVTMTFNHILSNISSFTVTGSSVGTQTIVNLITITHPKYGTYTCAAGGDSWTGLGTAEATNLSTSFKSASHPSGSPMIEGTESGTATNSFSLIPGTYSVRIKYSVTSGGLTRNYDKMGNVTLPAGKKNTISATLTNDLKGLSLSTSVTPWVTGNSATAWAEEFVGKSIWDLGWDGASKGWQNWLGVMNVADDSYYRPKLPTTKKFRYVIRQDEDRYYDDEGVIHSNYAFYFSGYSTFTFWLYAMQNETCTFNLWEKNSGGESFVQTVSGWTGYSPLPNYSTNYYGQMGNISKYNSISFTGLDPGKAYRIIVDLVNNYQGSPTGIVCIE